jgi:glycosyltransferase involved in cell wall biosynthesis
MNLAVVIPALNEEQALPDVLQSLRQVLPSLAYLTASRVIVADNGSTDRTAEVARRSGAEVVSASRRGYGSACQAGLGVLLAETDVVVFMDGDHSVFAEDLDLLLQPLVEKRADFVLGIRKPIDRGALTLTQRLGNSLACFLMHQLYGYAYHDLGPYRAIRWPTLQALGMRDPAFGWTIEMQIKALQYQVRIEEVPVRYRSRIGTSKISGTFLGSLKAGRAILWTVAKYAYGK